MRYDEALRGVKLIERLVEHDERTSQDPYYFFDKGKWSAGYVVTWLNQGLGLTIEHCPSSRWAWSARAVTHFGLSFGPFHLWANRYAPRKGES